MMPPDAPMPTYSGPAARPLPRKASAPVRTKKKSMVVRP
jgi:hypothetical protein